MREPPRGVARAVVVQHQLPRFDRERGSRRVMELVEHLCAAGTETAFWALEGAPQSPYARALHQRGVPTLLGPEGAEPTLAAFSPELAIVAFWHTAATAVPVLRRACPRARVIVDSVDLHFVREARRRRLDPAEGFDPAFGAAAAAELAAYSGADAVLTVSEVEQELLETLLGARGLCHTLPLGEDAPPSEVAVGERRGMVFVGNFEHAPNVEAVAFLLSEVLPRISTEVLAAHPLTIVGNESQRALAGLAESSGITAAGWVPSVVPYLHRARLALFPLLHGGGVKGKVLQAMMAGTPVVTTSIGAEGIDAPHGAALLVADDPASLASQVEVLALDAARWAEVSAAGRSAAAAGHSAGAVGTRLGEIVRSVAGQPAPTGPALEALVVHHPGDDSQAWAELRSRLARDPMIVAQTWLDPAREDPAAALGRWAASSRDGALVVLSGPAELAPGTVAALRGGAGALGLSLAVAADDAPASSWPSAAAIRGLAGRRASSVPLGPLALCDGRGADLLARQWVALGALAGRVAGRAAAAVGLVDAAAVRWPPPGVVPGPTPAPVDLVLAAQAVDQAGVRMPRRRGAPELSVVIATYNRAELLSGCLASLAAQDLGAERFEIVVVDDGSHDATAEVISGWRDGLPQLHSLRIAHGGRAPAKNLGILAAASPVVVLFDDDDVAAPGMARAHLEAHDRHPQPSLAVLGRTEWAAGLIVTPFMHFVTQVDHFLFAYPKLSPGQQLDWRHFWEGRLSCKREFLVTSGLHDQSLEYTIDIELGYRLDAAGLKVLYEPAAMSYMARPVDLAAFVVRAEAKGRAQARLAALHPGDEMRRYCGIDEVVSEGEAAAQADALLAEALLLEQGGDGAGPGWLEALHDAYRATIRAHIARGVLAGLAEGGP